MQQMTKLSQDIIGVLQEMPMHIQTPMPDTKPTAGKKSENFQMIPK